MRRKYKLSKACFGVMIAIAAGYGGTSVSENTDGYQLYQNSGEVTSLLKNDIIDMKIAEIIKELGLYKSDDLDKQLEMCCKVQKYIIMHNDYDESMIGENRGENLEESYINDLYKVLIQNKGICTSNSAEFKEILSRAGIDVKCVYVVSKDTNQSHMCNLVNLAGAYYYFDSTLEKTIYDSNIYDPEEVFLFCAGLGSKNYEQYYKPIGVMNDDFDSEIQPMPTNLSKEDIAIELVNSTIGSDIKKMV